MEAAVVIFSSNWRESPEIEGRHRIYGRKQTKELDNFLGKCQLIVLASRAIALVLVCAWQHTLASWSLATSSFAERVVVNPSRQES